MDRLGFERPLPECSAEHGYDSNLTYQQVIDLWGCFPALPQCAESSAILLPHNTYEEVYALGCVPVCQDEFILNLSKAKIEALSSEEQVELLKILGILDVDAPIPTQGEKVLELILQGQRRYAHPDIEHGRGSPCASALFRAGGHGVPATEWANEHNGRFITESAVVFCAECHGEESHRILPPLSADIQELRENDTEESQVRIPFLREDWDPNNGCTTCHGLHDYFPFGDVFADDVENQASVRKLHPMATNKNEESAQEEAVQRECRGCHTSAYRPGSPAAEARVKSERLGACVECHLVDRQQKKMTITTLVPSAEDPGKTIEVQKTYIWEEE